MTFLDNFKEPLVLNNPGVRLPEFKLDDRDYIAYNIPKDASNNEILRIFCREGYREKFNKGLIPKDKVREYAERVNYELKTLEETHFTDYILLILKFVRFRDQNNFYKSFGRGSCAGSLVCHLIGITNCDPIEHGLFFERFISKNRASINVVDGVTYLNGTLPDIDLDFADEQRAEVINYVHNEHKGRFVKLSTTGTFATKALTGELCKIFFNWKKEDYSFLTKEVVAKHGKNPSPKKVISESKIYSAFCDNNPEFVKVLNTLHECINSTSSHASAYFLSYDPLEEVMPVQYGKKKNELGEEEGEIELISTYDMYTAEALGIKADLLGIKCLTVVGNVAKAAGIDLDSVDLNDYESIYNHLQNFDFPHGIFQASGDGVVKAVRKIKPKNLEETSVVSAIARPGAQEFIDDYADYTNNGVVSSLHPLFDDILQETALKVIYQEQVLSLMVKLGFTKIEAETIRRGIGKKELKYIAPLEEEAYKRGKELNIPPEATKIAFDLAKKSADYSFNKSLCPCTTKVISDRRLKAMSEIKINDKVLAYHPKKNINHYVKVLEIFKHKVDLLEIELENNIKIRCSKDHKFLCEDGFMHPIWEIQKLNLAIVADMTPFYDNYQPHTKVTVHAIIKN